jgi:hypothetical protein
VTWYRWLGSAFQELALFTCVCHTRCGLQIWWTRRSGSLPEVLPVIFASGCWHAAFEGWQHDARGYVGCCLSLAVMRSLATPLAWCGVRMVGGASWVGGGSIILGLVKDGARSDRSCVMLLGRHTPRMPRWETPRQELCA